MANTRGVFTLQEVKYALEDGEWILPDQAFFAGSTESPNVGYYAGGQNPSQTPAIVSTVDKTNFDTDTTAFSPSSNLAVNHQIHGSFSSISAGYFGGGGNPSSPGSSSQVQKLSYSSETTSISPQSNLTQARGYPTGCSNTQNGYFIGGYIFPTAYTTAEKLSFSTDTPYFLSTAVFTTQRYGGASAGNQSVAYFAGGLGPSGNAYDSLIDKLTYSTDTTARLPDDLTRRRVYPAGVGNADAGFFAGGTSYTGAVPGPTANVSDIDKLTYSNETVSANPSNLSVARASVGSAGNTTSGYYAGGNPGPVSTMDKITLSTGSVSAVPGAALSLARYVLAGASPRSNAFPTTGYLGNIENLKGNASPGFGYWAANTEVVKHTFSTDNAGRVPFANLNIGTYAQAAMSNPTNFYSVSGGNPVITSAQRVSYASDTATLIPGAAIGQGVRQTMGLGNMDQGYILGGSSAPGVAYSIVEKLSYSTETSARVPSGDLIQNNTVAGSAGTPSFGVLGGGFSTAVPGRVSYFQKLQYSNDTNAQIPSANLPQVNGNLTATGNGYAGYRAGGETPSTISNISRHVYSTDSVNYLPQSLANGAQTNFEGNGSVQAAYWGGANSNVNRMNYSTETGYSIPTTSINLSYMGAASAEEFDMPQPRPETPTLSTSVSTGVPNTGYFGGGATPSASSTMDKVNYSTDTSEAVPGANLSSSKDSVRAASSTTAGYFGGGNPGPVSTMNKVTYSADTTAAVPGANLTNQRYQATAVMSTTAGYFCGGRAAPVNYSFIDKLTFSSDTTAALPSAADLNGNGSSGGSRGNQLAGYISGGWNYPGMENRTDKLNYSTETTFAVPSAYLNTARYGIRGMSSAYAGYFSGGTNEPTVLSSTERLDYSTDVSAAVPSAPLPSASSDTASTSNLSSGFFLRGSSASLLTSVSKLNFVTETWSESTVQLSQARYAFDATSARDNVVGNAPNIV